MTSIVPNNTPLATRPQRDDILAAAERAVRIVAPVWPLHHFVAVNPFLGVTHQSFIEAARTMGESAGARLTMPREFYVDALRSGRIGDAALESAIVQLRRTLTSVPAELLPTSAAAVRAAVLTESRSSSVEPLPTAGDVIGPLVGLDLPRVISERISVWAASYFDAGQASWRSPWRDLPPYGAWQAEASHDRTPEVLGIHGFRAFVDRLPATARDAIASCVARLGVPSAHIERYLQRLTMSIAGWAAYARYEVWNSELYGEEDDTLLQLLAVRLAWELAVIEAFAPRGAREAWRTAMALEQKRMPNDAALASLAIDLVLQSAYDIAFQDSFVQELSRTSKRPGTREVRPAAQAAFCIDVRSEIIRRYLERVATGVETIGFAGFFGFPIEYIPAGQERGGAQCPVLLKPSIVVAEVVGGDHGGATPAVRKKRQVARWAKKLWRSFKQGAVSCFGFVGPVGLAYSRKLVTDALALTRPVPHPAHDGIDPSARAALGPTLALASVADRTTGLPPADRVVLAETVLRAMSLTSNFARVVLLAGHGSTTVNNPHATGLDCGACGGHTGEANARVAAAVLNDPDVRRALVAKGIPVPNDTLFVAGLHDTTTDDVTIFDRSTIPSTHRDDVARLEEALTDASRLARRERASSLGIDATDRVDAQILARSRDWSQVRPEWGLAGCHSFIAAPRRRTAELDLGGRSFLHSYEWEQDRGFSILELIMTAPMVVASWINLQYYGSTVDNEHFGSGNKVLHNVVGTIGVFEGNGGDLRAGLPMQSVHNGARFVHEPLRLNVVIEAPRDAMRAVIAKHEGLRALLDNEWLYLWAMDADGRVSHRYDGRLRWVPVEMA